MATRSQKIKVGIFIVCGLALFAFVLVVMSLKSKTPTALYHIRFKESVRGLKKDSDVLYQGVPLGKVMDITVEADNSIVVSVGIETKKVILRKGTVATLTLNSLMGSMVIDLSGGDQSGPELKPGAFIPSRPSVLANITQDLPAILADIRNILSKLDRELGDMQESRLGDLVQNLDQAVQATGKTVQEVGDLIQTTRGFLWKGENETLETMRSLREALAEVKRTSSSLGDNPSSILWGKPAPEDPYVK